MEKRPKSFLFQSIGISIQKSNAVCILGTKWTYGKLEWLSYLWLCTTNIPHTRQALIYLPNFVKLWIKLFISKKKKKSKLTQKPWRKLKTSHIMYVKFHCLLHNSCKRCISVCQHGSRSEPIQFFERVFSKSTILFSTYKLQGIFY